MELPRARKVAIPLAALYACLLVLSGVNALVTPLPAFAAGDELLPSGWFRPIVMLSGLVLFGASFAASQAAKLFRNDGRTHAAWVFLAILFAYMGIDELVRIHERAEELTGIEWQLIYLPLALAAGLAWLRVLRHLPRGTELVRWGWIAAAGCWLLSQLFEAIFWNTSLHESEPGWLIASEEFLELGGSSLFMLTILLLLETRRERATA